MIPRGELLAELMRLKYGIAVAGSHGKTTTTSMIATILNTAGLDPTVVVGGKTCVHGRLQRARRAERFFVVESDESDGSFLKLSRFSPSSPTSITNIWIITPPSSRSALRFSNLSRSAVLWRRDSLPG